MSSWLINVNSIFNLICLWAERRTQDRKFSKTAELELNLSIVIFVIIELIYQELRLTESEKICKNGRLLQLIKSEFPWIQLNPIGNRRTIQFVDKFRFVRILFVGKSIILLFSCSLLILINWITVTTSSAQNKHFAGTFFTFILGHLASVEIRNGLECQKITIKCCKRMTAAFQIAFWLSQLCSLLLRPSLYNK